MRFSRMLLVFALFSVLSALAIAQSRKNPRDFPEGTTCPIHLGWEVDLVNGEGVPDPSSAPRIHQGLTFVAEGPSASVNFLACDRNSALIDGLSDFDALGETIEVRIDDVAVVREDVFVSHQRATVPEEFGCYFSVAEPFPFLAVGSFFDRTVAPPKRPFSFAVPFADDFSSPVDTESRWRFAGAELDEGEGNLVLARQFRPVVGEVQCSSASFKVTRLLAGQTYVLDFKWRVTGFGQAGEPVLTTSFDLNPGK